MANLNNLIVNGESRFVGGIYGNLTGTVNGFTIEKSVPSNAVFTDTNTYVNQSDTTTANYRAILMTYVNSATAGSGMTTNTTNVVYSSNKIYAQPSTGTLFASKFSGPLTGNVTGNCSGSSGSCTGNAATATLATASSNIRVTDTDSNTWYPVVFSTGSTANTNYAARVDSDSILAYPGVSPAAGTQGNTYLQLGNNKATATAGNKRGRIRIYGVNTSYTELVSGVATTARTITFPDATGTVSLDGHTHSGYAAKTDIANISSMPASTSTVSDPAGMNSVFQIFSKVLNNASSTKYFQVEMKRLSGKSGTVTFVKAFANPPTVIAVEQHSRESWVSISNVSNTGFTYSNEHDIVWAYIAIGYATGFLA